jgi:prepilin-type N-terminal cleavage/methylation domain-containing protein
MKPSSGFSLLEILFATAIVGITAAGAIGTIRGIEIGSDKELASTTKDHHLRNLISIIHAFPNEFRDSANVGLRCDTAPISAERFISWCQQTRGTNLYTQVTLKTNSIENSDFPTNIDAVQIVEPSGQTISVLIPPTRVEFPESGSGGQKLPDRGYRIKWWDSATAERFKGRYFGAPALPQYKIFRTWFKREMIEETDRLKPKYEDGTTLNVYRGSRDGFTIICDPSIGPCAKYEAGAELIEYISKGECGGACM